ncbi:MAG: hypothetical protein ACE5FG_06055 [Myxococcota bacterium]
MFTLWAAGSALVAQGVRTQIIDMDFIAFVGAWKASFAAARTGGTHEPVALTGDSMFMLSGKLVEEGIFPLPERITHELSSLAPERGIELIPLHWGGYGAFENYFLADEILATRPQRAILSLNLSSFSREWTLRWSRQELAGWIAPTRLPTALRLPLYWNELTADRLLLYVVLERGLGVPRWRSARKLQTRARSLPGHLDEWIDEYAAIDAHRSFQRALLRERKRHRLERSSRSGVLREYGPVLRGIDPDHPVLQIVRATLRYLRAHGVEVLFLIMPANLEHWRELGLLDDRRGLDNTIEAIHTAVRAGGGTPVDLHDLLGEQGFRDAAGHLSYSGPLDGHAHAARKIARAYLGAFPDPAPPAR